MSLPTSGDPQISLLASGVTAGYGDVAIVEEIDLRIYQSEIVAILGPNGAGKSTFLKALVGAVRLFVGEIHLGFRSIGGLSTEAIARAGVGYIPQEARVFQTLTVAENLELGAYRNRRRRKPRSEEVLELLPELRNMLDRRAGLLSGGERTMLGIARALMAEPSILLLDEPSAGLAPKVVEALWEHLLRLRAAQIPMLIVEQRTHEVLEIADRGYVLVNGRVALEKPASALLNDTDLAAVFLQGSSSPQDAQKLTNA